MSRTVNPGYFQPCGIKHTIAKPSGEVVVVYLPLEQLDVHAEIIDVSATVTLTQSFWQYSPEPTSQAKYVFPVPARAAVCGFEMRTEDGRVITAVAKEKEIARKEHARAIRRGRLTGLVEHVKDDVFTISLGSLPQLQMITTKLTYVLDLMDDEQTDHVRLQLPVCIGQRYGILPAGMAGAKTIPPERVRITSGVHMRGAIQSITSPSHPEISVVDGDTLETTNRRGRTIRYQSEDFLSQDFVLSIKADGLDAARCFAERGPDGSVALQLTVAPQVKLPPIPSQECIFLVDRSGSMEGDRIATAKRALVMLLRALPRKGTSFNIFSFGSSCSSLWQESMTYNERTLEEATTHVDGMDADFGGTEIRSSLKKAFRSRSAELPTSCFLLTDGEAYDTAGTIAVAKAAADEAKPEAPLRVFTLGIGSTTSTEMCEGISRASGGVCLMALSTESIVGKCSKLVKASRSEILRDVTVNWGVGANADGAMVALRQAPHIAPAIYGGIRYVVFALINAPEYIIPSDIVVTTTCVGTGEKLEFSVPVEELHRTEESQGSMIHTLAARRIIVDLEDQERNNVSEATKNAIIYLGEHYQLASKFTSFIAVEDESQKKADVQPEAKKEEAGTKETEKETEAKEAEGETVPTEVTAPHAVAPAAPDAQMQTQPDAVATGGSLKGIKKKTLSVFPAARNKLMSAFGRGPASSSTPMPASYSADTPHTQALSPPAPPPQFAYSPAAYMSPPEPAMPLSQEAFSEEDKDGALDDEASEYSSASLAASVASYASRSSSPQVVHMRLAVSRSPSPPSPQMYMLAADSSPARSRSNSASSPDDMGFQLSDASLGGSPRALAASVPRARAASGSSHSSRSSSRSPPVVIAATIAPLSISPRARRSSPPVVVAQMARRSRSGSPPDLADQLYRLRSSSPQAPTPITPPLSARFPGVSVIVPSAIATMPTSAPPLVLCSSLSSSVPGPRPSATLQEDETTQLVRLQSFDGAFRVTDALVRILGKDAIDEAKKVGVDETIWATILAIAYLQKHLADQPELLEGLVEKAREYIEEAGQPGLDFEELLARAVVLMA